jgi:two-component system, cell cycle sensor histidine kinase and response regulator CckA
VDPDQFASRRGFQMQLRSMNDIVIVAPPPWWTATRMKTVVASLALATLLVLAWVLALRRRVGHQTEQIRMELEKSARLEAELIRSSKLESLGVLAGGIAHDFNNLLTVIVGNLSLVLGDRRLVQEDEEFLRDSERAALRARDLTQQLLTFAKGGSPVRSAVLLPDIVREAAGFARHGSSVRCDFKFGDDLWPAHVDRGQISQVVHNIVLNALQAMPTGGVVEIALTNERVSAEASLPLQAGRFLKMVIRDTGAGISPTHLARIFDPYFTTKQQGSGLGLATVYSIVKKHAGHIDVTSELGVGTTFTIWLPASDKAPSNLSSERARSAPLSGRMLFMDDERGVRTMATTMLRRLGFEVDAVADGQAAIDAYVLAQTSGRPFRFVMLDLTVPGAMGGREAFDELRRIDPEVCAIVSSGYSNDPVVADFRAYGFQGRVPKPYEYEELASVVTSVLAGRSQVQVHR